MKLSFFSNYFDSIHQAVSRVPQQDLQAAVKLVVTVASNSRKVIVVGNGGSAAMASHVSVDFTKAAGVRAINFNEADLITCFANDYGYEKWVVEALNAYADPGDLAVLISSSGKSPNITNGAVRAKQLGLDVITLSGFHPNNELRKLGDVNLWVDSTDYNVVEMTHHIWLLSIVDCVIATKTVNS